jgi:hypothetical protein
MFKQLENTKPERNKRLYRSSDKVIHVAEAVRSQLSQFDYGQVSTLHGFVDIDEIHKRSISTEGLEVTRATLGIAETAFVISAVGTGMYLTKYHASAI